MVKAPAAIDSGGGRGGVLKLGVALRIGQTSRCRLSVAFASLAAEGHLQEADDVEDKHRKDTQRRSQPMLGERGITSPVCGPLCLSHVDEYRTGQRGAGSGTHEFLAER